MYMRHDLFVAAFVFAAIQIEQWPEVDVRHCCDECRRSPPGLKVAEVEGE